MHGGARLSSTDGSLAVARWANTSGTDALGRFERTEPRVLLTRQVVLGLVRDARGARFFAVAEPDAPGTWWPSSSTPTVRLCADRWCARCVSRRAHVLVGAAADAYAALASISSQTPGRHWRSRRSVWSSCERSL